MKSALTRGHSIHHKIRETVPLAHAGILKLVCQRSGLELISPSAGQSPKMMWKLASRIFKVSRLLPKFIVFTNCHYLGALMPLKPWPQIKGWQRLRRRNYSGPVWSWSGYSGRSNAFWACLRFFSQKTSLKRVFNWISIHGSIMFNKNDVVLEKGAIWDESLQ